MAEVIQEYAATFVDARAVGLPDSAGDDEGGVAPPPPHPPKSAT